MNSEPRGFIEALAGISATFSGWRIIRIYRPGFFLFWNVDEILRSQKIGKTPVEHVIFLLLNTERVFV